MEVIFTEEPIVTAPVALPSREIGAVVEFWGIVRETEGEHTIAGLRYEAYETMARREFARIHAELAGEHPIVSAVLVHRLGWVPTGEASLYVRIFSKHRGPGLAYCEELINRMKADVPIWKVTA